MTTKLGRIHWGMTVAIGALGLAAATVDADTNFVANGTLWDVGYTADFLPNDPGSNPAWNTLYVGAGSSATVSGGLLTMTRPTSGNGILYAEMDPANWDGNSGGSAENTVEFRMRGLNGQANADFTARLFFGDGLAPGWAFQFDDNRVYLGSQQYTIDTTAFHTYRITESSGVASLYVDNAPTPVLSGVVGNSYTANALFFGNDVSSLVGSTDWDFVRWTNEGAFAAVPEPTSVMLLLVGGAALLRLKRGQS